jgi:thiamine-phosphate pyrophosphorylase
LNFQLPHIYPITDTRVSGISHAKQVERLIAGGATLIQLREKTSSSLDFYRAAKEAIDVARKHGVKIIVNDRVDVALAVAADGVHLGQDDLPPAKARAILGENAIIGFSTHTIDQVLGAIKLPVNYIAIGPLFETNTKLDPDEVVGSEGLRHVRDAIGDFPLVAIGGINQTNLRSVFAAGADAAALIAALVSDAAEIEQRMSDFLGLGSQ